MDKDKIIAAIKEKVDLPDDMIDKASGLLEGQNFVGHSNKDDIIKMLVEKLKIDEGVANKIYEAVAGALATVNAVFNLLHLFLPVFAQPDLRGRPSKHKGHPGAGIDEDSFRTRHTVTASPAEIP